LFGSIEKNGSVDIVNNKGKIVVRLDILDRLSGNLSTIIGSIEWSLPDEERGRFKRVEGIAGDVISEDIFRERYCIGVVERECDESEIIEEKECVGSLRIPTKVFCRSRVGDVYETSGGKRFV